MNKFIFILPLLALVGTTIFLFQDQKISLENLVPVTFEQYFNCTRTISQNFPCQQTQEFISTYNAFVNLTDPFSATKACGNYWTYKEYNYYTNSSINKNNDFFDCYFNDQVRAIANSDECFFQHFYAPYYAVCGGFSPYAYPPYTQFNIDN